MKRLITFRHAKSGWDAPATRDFDRALNDRGRRAAATMGRFARDEGMTFDLVLSSPAVRCVETIEAFVEGYGRRLSPTWDRRIYLASTANLLEVVQDAPGHAATLMLCGHNPGIEELALDLAGSGDAIDELEDKYPTGSIAVIEFDTDDWSAVDDGGGRLVRFIRPRDLDATLGPED